MDFVICLWMPSDWECASAYFNHYYHLILFLLTLWKVKHFQFGPQNYCDYFSHHRPYHHLIACEPTSSLQFPFHYHYHFCTNYFCPQHYCQYFSHHCPYPHHRHHCSHRHHHRHHRPHRLWANFIFAIPNAIKLCCTTQCLSVDFAIGNGRKENLLGFNSKMKKKNQIVDLTYNLKTLKANGARDEDLERRKYFWCLENSRRDYQEYLAMTKCFHCLENWREIFLVLRKLGRDDQVCERGERVLTGRWKIRNCARRRRGLFIIC